MELKKKVGYISIFFLLIMLIYTIPAFAGYQRWNSLDYDVTLNPDGSMDVIETWNVDIEETNTLFKKFEESKTNDYKFTSVKISEVKNGSETFFEQVFEEQYHVDPGCYYALSVKDSKFEIAWHVGLDYSSDTRIYKMYYTVENAVKIYKDCTEFYWQFLSDENSMTGDNITGRIRLPKPVDNIEKFRIWGHGDLTSSLNKVSNQMLEFKAPEIDSYEMLEIRVVTEENIYNECDNIYRENKLADILEEEQRWADEANREREKAQKFLDSFRLVVIGIVIVNVLIFLLFYKKVKKYKEERVELEARYAYPKIEMEYFRDIPDEKRATPGIASYMYNLKNNNSSISPHYSKIFSATMLDLSLKGLIEFEVMGDKDVNITRGKKSYDESVLNTLPEDEKIVFELLKEAMLGRDSITPKEFSKFASKEYDLVFRKLLRIESIVQEQLIETGKISKERQEISKKWSSKATLYGVLAFVFIFVLQFMPGIYIGLILMCITCSKNSKIVSIMSENGYEESAQWKGLKKYMEDYSLLSERLVPDIVLWEKYLVYATAFGISKKVLEQLKSIHPELFEQAMNNDRGYGYWHMMSYNSLGPDTFMEFNKGLESVYSRAQSAYSVAHSSSSSGSGGGGGFSGGGGGRRWRRKLWRSLKIKM